MRAFFKNVHTGNRYEIIEFDKKAGTVTLRGKTATFTEVYTKERMKHLGYKLETEEDEDA